LQRKTYGKPQRIFAKHGGFKMIFEETHVAWGKLSRDKTRQTTGEHPKFHNFRACYVAPSQTRIEAPQSAKMVFHGLRERTSNWQSLKKEKSPILATGGFLVWELG
jgi:hypothetical protein